MKVQELRIGNYVLFGNIIEKIFAIGLDEEDGDWLETMNEENEPFTINVCDYTPILLTEEWLIKSNAKKVANTYHLDRFLLIWKPEYGYWYVLDLDSMTYLNKIEFVHEWQNFYFVMQGEELFLDS